MTIKKLLDILSGDVRGAFTYTVVDRKMKIEGDPHPGRVGVEVRQLTPDDIREALGLLRGLQK